MVLMSKSSSNLVALGELLDDASIGMVDGVAMRREGGRSEERSQIVHIDFSRLVLQIVGGNNNLGIVVSAIGSDSVDVCLSAHQVVEFMQ